MSSSIKKALSLHVLSVAAAMWESSWTTGYFVYSYIFLDKLICYLVIILFHWAQATADSIWKLLHFTIYVSSYNLLLQFLICLLKQNITWPWSLLQAKMLIQLGSMESMCGILGRSLWKLENTVIGTATPVLATCFWVLCWMAALLHSEPRGLLAWLRRHSQNTVPYSQWMLSVNKQQVNMQQVTMLSTWPWKLAAYTEVAVPPTVISSFHKDLLGITYTCLHQSTLDWSN